MFKHSGIDKDRIRSLIGDGSCVYMCGIGGGGMSALAELLLYRGVRVFGSDRAESDVTDRLIRLGIRVNYTERRENLAERPFDLLIYSLSVSEDHPEYRAALDMGIPAVSRAEALGAIMKEYKTAVSVSGSHGKSTVTAMTGAVLTEAGANPTVVCGADLGGGSSLRAGGDEYIVVEGCEYCDSFLRLSPTHTVLLNLDYDHTDYFSTPEALYRSFALAAEMPSVKTVWCASDLRLSEICSPLGERAVSYGTDVLCDMTYRIVGGGAYSTVMFSGKEPIRAAAPGQHNAENIAAATALCTVLGVDHSVIVRALSRFSGIPRRLELLCRYAGSEVYYDYAHHPKEIFMTLDTLKKMSYNRIAVVFAPHTYSRTRTFLKDFAKVLSSVRAAFILPIYGARESSGEVDEGSLVSEINSLGGNAYLTDGENFALADGFDCILLLGAGDLTKIKRRIVAYEKDHSSCGARPDRSSRNNGDSNGRG